MQEIQNFADFKSSNTIGNHVKRSLKSAKKTDFISNDYTDDYDDEGGENEEDGGYDSENVAGGNNAGRNASRVRRIHILKRVGTTYVWGRWEKWSRCSNSCVQIRKRQCIKR